MIKFNCYNNMGRRLYCFQIMLMNYSFEFDWNNRLTFNIHDSKQNKWLLDESSSWEKTKTSALLILSLTMITLTIGSI